jgi:alpha-L-fucosidase
VSDFNDGVPFAGRPLPTWYDDAKFGIFIHWGPYAVPCYAPVEQDMGELFAAGDWAEVFRWSPYTEWYLNSWALEGSATAKHHAATYGDRTYAGFVEEFRDRSVGVDVAQWAHLFDEAGARYVVPVTKHHDGYLMWPSDHPNPHRSGWMSDRDHIAELAVATRAHGMRFGLYYSGGLDWTFTPPPIDSFTSMIANVPSSIEYGDYVQAHVDELVARHLPSVLWNDIAWPSAADPNVTIGRYYDRVPDGVVNDRFDMLGVIRGRQHADFVTPEYSTKASSVMKWEVCRGIGRSFGYNRMETEATMPSVDELIWMLVDIVARGGNLLLNVGPSADGQIPLAHVVRLTGLGWWLRVNGAAIYGTRPWAPADGTISDGRPIRFTCDAHRVFALVQGAPADSIELPGVIVPNGAVVTMLGNDRSLPFRATAQGLEIDVPDHLPPAPVTVFAISRAD